jgi:hypothetical protein
MSANRAEQEYNNEVFIDNKPTEKQEMLRRKSHSRIKAKMMASEIFVSLLDPASSFTDWCFVE